MDYFQAVIDSILGKRPSSETREKERLNRNEVIIRRSWGTAYNQAQMHSFTSKKPNIKGALIQVEVETCRGHSGDRGLVSHMTYALFSPHRKGACQAIVGGNKQKPLKDTIEWNETPLNGSTPCKSCGCKHVKVFEGRIKETNKRLYYCSDCQQIPRYESKRWIA